MAKTTKQATKSQKNTAKSHASRKLKEPAYKPFRLQRPKVRVERPGITGAFRLLQFSLGLLKNNWKLFGGIVLVYFVLSMLLVRGFGASINVNDLREYISGIDKSNGKLSAGLGGFSLLAGNANAPSSDVASAYQAILLIVISLVVIWALRQTMAEVKVGVRDAFYKGLYPLVPFLLVLMVIGIQLLPALLGALIYSLTIGSSGIALTLLEGLLCLAIVIALVVWSAYMLTSSLFALYVVTLPDMRPIQALRSAKELVRYRRWSLVRKLLFLPVALLLLEVVIMLPIILFLTPLAEWVFFGLGMVGLAVVHTYMYNLYRELL